MTKKTVKTAKILKAKLLKIHAKLEELQNASFMLEQIEPAFYCDGIDSLEGQLNDAAFAVESAVRILDKR